MLGEKPLKFKFSAAESRLIFRETAPEDRALSEDEERRLTDLGFDFVPGSSETTEKAKEAFSEKMHLLDPQVKRFIITEGYNADQFADLMVTIGYQGESEYQKNVEAFDKEVSDLEAELAAKTKERDDKQTAFDAEKDPTKQSRLGLELKPLKDVVDQLSQNLAKLKEAKPTKLSEFAAADRKLLKDRIYVAKKTYDIGSFVNVLISKSSVLDRSRVPSSKEVLNPKRNPYIRHLYLSPLPAHARNFSSVVEGPGFVTLKFNEAASRFRDPEALYPDIERGVDHYMDKGEILEDLDPKVKAALKANGDSLRNPVPLVGSVIDFFADRNFAEAKTRLFNLIPKAVKEAPDYTIDGYAYVALVWPMMERPLRHELRGQKVPTRIVDDALAHPEDYYEFNNLVLDFAKHYKDGRIDQDLLKRAAVELRDTYGTKARETLFGPRVMVDGKEMPTDEELREKHYQAKYNPELGMISRSELSTFADNEWLIAVRSRKVLENPDNWDPSTPIGLARVRFAWEKVGIAINEKPYNQILNQLSKMYDGDYQNKFPKLNPVWMKHPDLYRDQITGAMGKDGEDFFVAWDRYKTLRDHIKVQHHRTMNSTKSIEQLGGAEYADKVLEFGKKNVQKLMSAVKDGDWGTVAVYAAGAWALYQIFKNKTDNAAVKFVKDYAPWIALGYFGVKAAEAAGYEPLKALGLKDKYAELIGTNLHDWVDVADIPELQGRDGAVFATTAKMNIRQMWEARMNTHHSTQKEAPGWIDPMQFDYWRPKFSGLYGKLGQKFKQNPEYEHVGKELYQTIVGIEKLYEKTLMTHQVDGNAYYGISFEQALTDPDLKDSTVEEFLGAIIEHSKGKKIEAGASAQIQERFEEVLEGKQMAPNIRAVEKIKDGDVAAGTLMGLPVAIQHRGDQYVVYYMPDYRGDAETPGKRLELGRISASGAVNKGEAEALKTSITERFKLAYNEGRLAKGLPEMKDVSWDGMKWSFEEEYSKDRKNAFEKWGVSTEKGKMSVSIGSNGSLETGKLDTLEGRLLKKIGSDPRFSFLNAFSGEKSSLVSLTDVKLVKGVATAKLKIADLELPIFYGKDGIMLQKSASTEPFDAPQFKEALKEIVLKGKGYSLEGKMATLRERIANANPDWWSHFSNLGGDSLVLDGPISKRKSEMLMNLIYSKLAGRIDTAYKAYPTLKDLIQDPANNELSLGYMLDQAVKDAESSLDSAIGALKPNVEVKAGEFDHMVTGPLLGASLKSSVVIDQLKALVDHAYEESWGVGSSDHFGADFHKKLERELSYFTKYAVDDHYYVHRDADGNFVSAGMIELDELKTIPTSPADPKDPEWRGWYALEYNRELADLVKQGVKPTKDFETWAAERGPLKGAALEHLKKYSHEDAERLHQATNGAGRYFHEVGKPVTKHMDQLTELDKRVIDVFDDELRKIFTAAADDFDLPKAKKLLYEDGKGTKVGIFVVRTNLAGDRLVSRLWDFTESIKDEPRHIQDKMIHAFVNKNLLSKIYSNKDMYFDPTFDLDSFLRNNPTIHRYWPF